MKSWPAHIWVAVAAAGIGAYPALIWARIGIASLGVPWCGSPRPAHIPDSDWSYSCSTIPTFVYLLPLLSLIMIAGGAVLTRSRPFGRGIALLSLGTALLWVVIGGGLLAAGVYFFFFAILLGPAAIAATAACYMVASLGPRAETVKAPPS